MPSFVFMKRFLFIGLFFILSCGEKPTAQRPANILSEEKMQAVLLDKHLIKAQIAVFRTKQEISMAQEDSLMKSCYEKHQCSQASFDSSLSYYSLKETTTLEDIYTQVVDSLNRLEAALQD